MSGEYNINWTDDQGGANPLKPRFIINPNEVNGPGNAASDTPLQLPGRFAVNYGEILAEDMLHLMEHFCAPTAPVNPTLGMLWFDSDEGGTGALKVYNPTSTSADPITGYVIVGTGASGGGGAGTIPEISPAPSGTNFTATAGANYFVDTSTGAVTVTLPITPTVGTVVGFIDVAGTFDINSLFVNGNGETIMGDPLPMENNIKYNAFRLGYSGATYGWRIIA